VLAYTQNSLDSSFRNRCICDLNELIHHASGCAVCTQYGQQDKGEVHLLIKLLKRLVPTCSLCSVRCTYSDTLPTAEVQLHILYFRRLAMMVSSAYHRQDHWPKLGECNYRRSPERSRVLVSYDVATAFIIEYDEVRTPNDDPESCQYVTLRHVKQCLPGFRVQQHLDHCLP